MSDRKVAAVCTIACQTEEAESLNFNLNIYEDESVEQVESKLKKFWDISESRRKFNWERMNAKYEEKLALLNEQAEASKE